MHEHELPIELRPPVEADAEALFPLIHGTLVTDTLAWEGPQTLEEYRQELRTRELQVAAGLLHFYTIVERSSASAIGSADVRPEDERRHATLGLWIGAPYQRRGYGTAVIGELARHAFEGIGVGRVEACVFVGNWPSRKAFERNGFRLLGMVSGEVIKRGEPVQEWRMGLDRETWQKLRQQPLP